jgi:hypothetical protein
VYYERVRFGGDSEAAAQQDCQFEASAGAA